MARKKLDCSECGAEYSIAAAKGHEDPSYCPFCGDPGTNFVSENDDDDVDDDEDDDEDGDFSGFSIGDEDDE